MSEPTPDEAPDSSPGDLTISEMLADLTWEQLTSDGIITIEEVEQMIRAEGMDPDEYDYLYE